MYAIALCVDRLHADCKLAGPHAGDLCVYGCLTNQSADKLLGGDELT